MAFLRPFEDGRDRLMGGKSQAWKERWADLPDADLRLSLAPGLQCRHLHARPESVYDPASNGETTPGTVLESAEILKLFCDVSGDSYALFSEFGIRVRGIKDVQNMQIAHRDRLGPTTSF